MIGLHSWLDKRSSDLHFADQRIFYFANQEIQYEPSTGFYFQCDDTKIRLEVDKNSALFTTYGWGATGLIERGVVGDFYT